MKHNYRIPKLYPILLIIATVILSCNAGKNTTEEGITITLSKISKKPAKYEGKEVHLEGVYLGWKHGDCHFPASFTSTQVTRSDWAFSEGGYCCFVTGSLPEGLKSTPDSPVPISLTAIVKLKDSKVYLQYLNSRLK
jgi:hypothetical protein